MKKLLDKIANRIVKVFIPDEKTVQAIAERYAKYYKDSLF